MHHYDFKNRTAIITGGAQGFGLDIAKKFLSFGSSKVIIWDIDENELKKAQKEINSPNLFYNVVDVSNFENVNDTITLNKVEDRVSVKHVIVEKPIHLMGFVGEAPTILAKDFPAYDVLVMDCEGAELPILQNLTIKPRLIIVETHPMFDSPEEKIIELLKNLNYDIISNDLRQESLEILSAIRKN